MSTDVRTDETTTVATDSGPSTAPVSIIDPDKVFVPVFEPATVRDPEAGLRTATRGDYVVAATWGAVTASATWLAAVPFVPAGLFPALLVLGAGLGFLGYMDYVTRLIRNTHNLAFGLVSLVMLATAQISFGMDVLVPALIAGAAAFIFMLALTMFSGFAGGGDIKLSPIPAGVLAAFSPLAAMLWLLFTFVLCLGGMIAVKISGSGAQQTAMAPFMAAGAVAAIIACGMLNNHLGL